MPWGGFHHVALVTPDLDATIRFYRDVLGMQAGEVLSGGGVIPARHCFIRPGAQKSMWGLHFFEHLGAEIPRHPGGLGGPGFIAGALQRVAFALPDADAAARLQERLEQHGVEASPTGTIGPIRSMRFVDAHGLLLEATWPNADHR